MNSFFKHTKDILGMNARNLLYTQKFNSREHKNFANNKLFTKQFLESRNIQVAKTYHTIKTHSQLSHQFLKNLPESFVIKPNKGWGGNGILIITHKKGSSWVTSSGKILNSEYLFQHCVSILDGKYSISGIDDTVLIEEVLEKHTDFRHFNDIGLPDIRLIVFNRVPIMGMIRVPTEESDGKANLEIGGIGVGIDIGTGITTRGCQYSDTIRRMPNGNKIEGFKVPFWDEILFTGARIQHFTKIGYIGIDFTITKTGIKVLEINTLPGLKIQVANKIPLRKRLEKVQDLKVKTPEEGVEIAKTLFTQKIATTKSESYKEKPVIGIEESVILNMEKPISILAKIDTQAEKNTIRKDLFTQNILDITLSGKRMKLPVHIQEDQEADLILATKFLHDFYIDPSKKEQKKTQTKLTQELDEKVMKSVDEKIFEIEKKIKFLSHINPINIDEQKELFLRNPEFSPKFIYKTPHVDFQQIKRELKKIPRLNHELAPLFEKKIEEIENKINLIQNRDTGRFQEYSEKIFGGVELETYQSAIKFCEKDTGQIDPSEELDLKTAEKRIKDFLKEYKLSHWSTKIIEDAVVDIQVSKSNKILLRSKATFKENRLNALLMHEIGTHVFRFENGKRQPLRILERGTAGYLRTEEGLAIWNQNQLGLELGTKYFSPAHQVIAIYEGKYLSFLELFHTLKKKYNFDDKRAWKMCIRAKRGLTDTSSKEVFTKDAVYFKGYQDVLRYVKEGKSIYDLYRGKIGIKDLELINKRTDLVPPKLILPQIK